MELQRPIIDYNHLEQALAAGQDPLPLFRDTVKRVNQTLGHLFEQGHPVKDLVTLRSSLIDTLLVHAWKLTVPQDEDVALIAVGGYGRGELHPASDIDLMLLLGSGIQDKLMNSSDQSGLLEALSDLLTFFWDIGLEVGHSVRTLDECVCEAKRDITVATNLMESRLLAGPESLHESLRFVIGPKNLWPSDQFFKAKREEQKARYLKYDDTVSNLEPNIKESPGGLRDIQTVVWVAKRHFDADTMHDLVSHGFLTKQEFEDLDASQQLLWKIRFALHQLTGRREDRILFDYQKTLAEQFGFEDDAEGLGIEKFMQQYYQTAIRISRMNEMLLQLFEEVIVLKYHLDPPKQINSRFHSRSGYLEVVNSRVFANTPLAMLELFLIMEQHPELHGVRASTIRLIRSHRHLIDDNFRASLQARSLFMEILRQPRGITHELRRMNRYGILSRYIPAFYHIVGRMQYDLFHVYTVDEHTLFVICNLRRFMIDKHRNEFPLCNDVMERLPKPELIFLAALFHDIAKGRGGNHSTLGAEHARKFCQHHELGDYDSNLVAWLVENHLLFSKTAQRKDISDPEVIRDFSEAMGSLTRLDYLYLLTVADIRATDPKKWNNWKNLLLRELYHASKQALLRGLENPQHRDEIVQNKQAGARHFLVSEGIEADQANRHWLSLSLDYFLYHTWEEIAWQTKIVTGANPEDLPLVLVRKSATRGGTEIFHYGEDRDNLFAFTTSLLDQLGLNIVGARLETADTGYTLNSYLVLEQDGGMVEDSSRKDRIQTTLHKALQDPHALDPGVSRRVPRQLKHFSTPTRIDFGTDEANQRTIMKLVADDRPGLLSQVGYAFRDCGVRLIKAKIATIGAEAQDTFFITDLSNLPLSEPSQWDCLKEGIFKRLDDSASRDSTTG
ncbi:MAG: [protein-PII] uridylyltransferase [Gammaproteobacteria bacterium]|nr:[protein-PII] uridylyltransferase [Gammaproteobacteria bacterium]